MMGNLPLLVLVGGLMLSQSFLLLDKVVIKVPLVAVNLLVGDLKNASANTVEEFPVVGDGDQGTRKFL